MSFGDYSNNMERNDYDIASSQAVQSDILRIAGQVEAALNAQEKQITDLMGGYEADTVSEEYKALYNKWAVAGLQVHDIIKQLRASLEQNDGIAQNAIKKAASQVSF